MKTTASSAPSPGARPRRYLALWFPWLPGERARREAASPDLTSPDRAAPDLAESVPLVLVARQGNALRLAAVDQAARRQGLNPGMTLADARARCPGLASLPHDPHADALWLEHLAGRMARFTPLVAVDGHDGLVLDITGCAHLFGGEAALAHQAIAACELTARHALADHAATARALARFGRPGQEPRDLPVAALELPEEGLAGLRRAGLASLGDLARRPLAGLAARFGDIAVSRLRAILGESDSPLTPRRTLPPIRLRARFPEPLLRTDDALEAIEDLLGRACRQLEARHLGGRRFAVLLERSDGARRHLAVETGLPLRDPAPVMRLLRERIDSLADPLDPGFGFDAVALAVSRTEPLAARQIGLDAVQEDQDGAVSALIDRLTTRLGPDSVLRLAPAGTHIPEAAQRLVAPQSTSPPLWPDPAERPPRPLFLLDPPQPITALASVPDGPPQRFRWRGQLHEVRLAEGPERIAPEWWRHPEGHLPEGADLMPMGDAWNASPMATLNRRAGFTPGCGETGSPQPGVTRDYYRVEDGEGQRFWLFRHGLFDETASPRWYLHGLFP